MRRALAASLIVLLPLVGGACRSDDPVIDSSGPATTTAVRVIGVEVLAGKVVGGDVRVSLAVGEPARLNVRSDVTDEIHVSVLDQRLQVPAGGVATLDLVTDRAGTFEVRLVEQGLLLATIEVVGGTAGS